MLLRRPEGRLPFLRLASLWYCGRNPKSWRQRRSAGGRWANVGLSSTRATTDPASGLATPAVADTAPQPGGHVHRHPRQTHRRRPRRRGHRRHRGPRHPDLVECARANAPCAGGAEFTCHFVHGEGLAAAFVHGAVSLVEGGQRGDAGVPLGGRQPGHSRVPQPGEGAPPTAGPFAGPSSLAGRRSRLHQRLYETQD